MKYRAAAFLLALLCLLSGCKSGGKPELAPGLNIFVSPSGSDGGDGSFAHPFQTLQRAQLELRALRAQSGEAITVNIRGGEYFLAEALSFGPKDSGSGAAPVTWQAYRGENVLISGGIRLPADKFRPVEDEALLSRVLDEGARSKLMYLDLSGYVDELPGPIVPDSGCDIRSGGPEIYVNGSPLTQARWPNDLENEAFIFADSAEALSEEPFAPVRLSSKALAERAELWSPEAWRSMYINCFMSYDWANGVFELSSFDADSGELTTVSGFWDPPQEHPRFYVFNLPEEIDVPGESCIDYGGKLVYFYPPEGFENAEIYLSLLEGNLIYLNDAQHIRFRGLNFGYARGNLVEANGIDGLSFEGCTAAHCSGAAFYLYNATNCTVKDSSIYDCVDGSVYLWDGLPRESLVSGGNLIENNEIYAANRLNKWTTGSIYCESTGIVIRHNEIHDEPFVSLFLNRSNDALVEYNEFYRTGLLASDTGAIYYGYDASVLGVVIRYNYFHDIGNSYGGIGQQAIFCDDGAMMPLIFGNIFVNASDDDPETGAAVKANGAQFGVLSNNIFVDAPLAAYFQSWGDWSREPIREDEWLRRVYGLDGNDALWTKLTESGAFSEDWRRRYAGTQWSQLWDWLSPSGQERLSGLNDGDEAAAREEQYRLAPSQTNLFDGNVCVNIAEMYAGNGRAGTNYWAGSSIFTNYELGNYSLTDEGLSEIRDAIPGFEEIPFAEIGRKP